MTTHELARKLLEGPDETVLVPLGFDEHGEDFGNCIEVYQDLICRADVEMSEEGYWRAINRENRLWGQPATILGLL